MRVSFVNVKLGKIICLLPLCLALLFVGCEIGLGAAIDTEAPVVKITSPETNDILKESFEVIGECNDDAGIESVEIVRLYNNENKDLGWTNLGHVTPVYDPSGQKWNWSLPIEYDTDLNKWICKTENKTTVLEAHVNGSTIPLMDGTYIIDVRSFDTSGRQSTIASRVFDVDRMEPFLLLSAPSSFEEGTSPGVDYTIYGRSVTIRGVTADNHSVKRMTVKAYKDPDGTQPISLAKSDFTDFDMATTTVTIAAYSEKYAKGEAVDPSIEALHKNYMALFGINGRNFSGPISGVDPKEIYISIELEDDIGNITGNNSPYVYCGGTLIPAIRTAIGNKDATFEASDGKMLLDGTYNRSTYANGNGGIVKNMLLGKAADKDKYLSYDTADGKNLLYFNVCPDNATRYSISGQEVGGGNWGSVTGQGALSVTITAGRDKAPLSPKSVKVKIYNSNASGTKGSNIFTSDPENSTKNCFVNAGGIAVNDLSSVAPGGYKLNLAATGQAFKSDNYYLVEIEGQDTSGVEMVGDATYGFVIVTSGQAPSISSKEDGEERNVAGVADGLKVEINDPEGTSWSQSEAINYSVDYYEGYLESLGKTAGATTVKAGVTNQKLAGSSLSPYESSAFYDATIPLNNSSLVGKNATIVVTAIPKNGVTEKGGNPGKFMIHSDGVAPVITVDNDAELKGKKINLEKSNYLKKNEDGSYSYEIRGTISDDQGTGVKTIEYKYGSDEWKKIDSTPVGAKSVTSWIQTINIEPGKDSISLRAEDKVGNKSSEINYTGLIFGEGVPTIERTEPENVEPYYNDTKEFEFTIRDADKVDSVTVKVLKNGMEQSTPIPSVTGKGTANAGATLILPKSDGEWTIELTAENPSGGISEKMVVSTIIDSTKPVIDSLTIAGDPKDAYTSTTLKLDGTCTESNGLKKVSYYITTPNGDTNKHDVDASGTTFSITPTEFSSEGNGKNTIHVTVTDLAGNESAVWNSEVIVDQNAPSLSFAWYDDNGDRAGLSESLPSKVFYGPNKSLNEMTIYGLVSDEGGVKDLYFTLGGTAVSPTVTYTTTSLTKDSIASQFTGASWVPLSDSNRSSVKAWKAVFTQDQIDAASASGGLLSVYAKDSADHRSVVLNLTTLAKDEQNPELNVLSPKNGAVITEKDIVNDNFIVRGTWSDRGSGTSVLEWAIDGGAFGETNVDAPKGTALVSWSITIPKSELSATLDRTIHLKAKDSANNEATVDIENLKFDYNVPTLTSSPDLTTYYNYDTSSLVINFTASDADNIGKPAIIIDSAKKNKTSVAADSYFTDNGNGTAKFTLKRDGSDDGEWTIVAHAKDPADRSSSQITLTTVVDGTKPTIDPSSIKVEEAAYDPDAWFKSGVIRIGAVATETGSGISQIYYQVADVKPADIKTTKNGTTTGTSGNPFAFTVSNLEQKKNTVWIMVEDKAGNCSETTPVYVQVDKENPNVSSSYYTYDDVAFSLAAGKVRSNKNKNLVVYGNVSDVNSGVDTLTFKIGDNIVPATITYSNTEVETVSSASDLPTFDAPLTDSVKSYRAEIAKANLQQGNVRATVVDKAGNTKQETLFSIVIDQTNPVLTLVSPMTKINSSGTVLSVNGNVTVTGKAVDEEIASVSMCYSFNGGAFTTPITRSGSAAGNWSFDLPMTKNESGTVKFIDDSLYSGDSKHVVVKVRATDAAGNFTEHTYDYLAAPESDRPEITLNNIELKNSNGTMMSDTEAVWLRSRTIYGNIRDDDGISQFGYRIGSSGDFTPIAVSSGSWNITLDSDGDKNIYFFVEDSEGAEFTSALSSSSQYSAPKLNNSGKDYKLGTSVLKLKVDTQGPTVGSINYQVYNKKSDSYGAKSDDFAAGLFGGDYSKVKFSFEADDSNGISEARVKIDGTDVSVPATDTDSDRIYETSEISLKDFVSGTYRGVVEVVDMAGTTTQRTMNFVVDNDKPAISINVPTGSVKSASTVYGTVSKPGAKVYFAVTEETAGAPAESAILTDAQVAANNLAVNKWMEIKDASLAWNVYFDDKKTADGTHTDLIKWYLGEVLNNKSEIIGGRYNTETPVKFHIMAVDSYGNISTKSDLIMVDPQGDRPSVAITYPSEDGKILGGTIRVMGTATDNEEAKKVGLFIDVNNNGHWDSGDVAKLKLDYPEYKFGKLDPENKTFEEVASVPGTISENDAQPYALMLDVKNNSWSVSLNMNHKLDPEGDVKTTEVKIWAFAVDNKGNNSTTDVTKNMASRAFSIDKESPKIGKEILKGANNAQKGYEDGASVNGVWHYTAVIYDDVGISSVSVDKVVVVENGTIKPGARADTTVTPYDGELGKGFSIDITMGTADKNVVKEDKREIVFVEEKDQNPQSGTKEVVLNVDTKNPDVIVRGQDGYNIKNYDLGDGNVVNMNGFYTFGSKASEDPSGNVNQTGVERVAFYITRDVSGYEGLYDVLLPADQSKIANYSSSGSGVVQDNNDHLWWKTATISSITDKTLTLSASDKNIHNGGLVKINNVIYRIDTATGVSVTLDTEDTSIAMPSDSKAYFAVAAVVDNPIQEGDGTGIKNAAGYWNKPEYDDKDCMVESLTKEGSTWTWEASINTKNVGDGKATIHYVVFDKAGNCTEQSVPIYIANNLPRIAGLVFATDDDGDKVYSAQETYSFHNVYEKGMSNGRDVTSAVFPLNSTKENPKSVAIVRNDMMVMPEIVGGNGVLDISTKIYKYSPAQSDWEATSKSLGMTLKADDGTELENVEGSLDDEAHAINIEYSVFNMVNATVEDGNNQKLSLTITDSTPGEAMRASVDVIVDIALRDTKKPEVYIKPLYWNSRKDNSIYENSPENGHIEISSDLIYTGSQFTGTSGLKDKDPKVSGKFRLEGIALDNNQLSKLDFKILQDSNNGARYEKKYVLGTFSEGVWKPNDVPFYDPATGIPSAGLAWTVTQATYKDLVESGVIDSCPANAEEDDIVPFFTQDYGHIVKWIVYIDSESFLKKAYSNNGVKLDVPLAVGAQDRGNPSIDGGTLKYNAQYKADGERQATQSGGNDGSGQMTDWYRIDVVPYITEVETELTRNSVAVSRTAQGHYPIRAVGNSKNVTDGETVTFKGFNLGPTVTKKVGSGTNDLKDSGFYSFDVDGIEAMNNINNNNAKGSYGKAIDDSSTYQEKNLYAYNRQPNNKENNLLTDDIYFDVWQFNSEAGVPYDGGRLEQVTMKVNPSNGMIGFGFINGPFYYSMANNNWSSYVGNRWKGADFCSSASFTYDDFGFTYGTTMPGNEGDPFKLLRGTDKNNEASTDLENNTQGDTDKQRFRTPVFATSNAGGSISSNNAKTNLYLAYYDQMNDQIRFRSMQMTMGGTTITGMKEYGDQSYANNKKVACIVVGKDGKFANAGDYYSIGVVPKKGKNNGDLVVLVWYDAVNQALYYTYHDDPTNIGKVSATGMYDNSGWATPIAVFEGTDYEESGQFCKVAVDANGGVHIAGYDPLDLDLSYAYLAPGDVKSTVNKFKTCVVDSYGVVGSNLTLDVEIKNSQPVPHIGYYSEESSLPKYAKLLEPAKMIGGRNFDGSVNDEVTGNWEITTIPTASEIEMCSMQYNSINVALWKNASGVAQVMNSAGTASSSSNTSATVYGNGTANPVFGYSTVYDMTGDHIETAQLRDAK